MVSASESPQAQKEIINWEPSVGIPLACKARKLTGKTLVPTMPQRNPGSAAARCR